MWLLRAKYKITSCEVRPGKYDEAGICGSRDASALNRELLRMLKNSERLMRARTAADKRVQLDRKMKRQPPKA
jgi:hypothetical protein